jgi:predicted porin
MRIPFTLAALYAAVALAPHAAHAQSSVTVYGIVDASVRYADNAAAGGASLKTLGDGVFTGSRLGFRGTEDLGGGLRAFFTLEQGIDPSTGTLQQSTGTANYGQSAAPNGRAWGRTSLVGLGTPYGTITLGRQYTLAHDMSGRFQPQSNPNQDSLSVLSGHHVARQDNMAKYTHKFGPVGVALSATAGEGTNGKAWGVAGSYTAGPVDLVAYAQQMDSFNGAETRKIYGLGGSFAVTKGVKAYLGGMQRSHDVSRQKNKVITTGVNFNVTDQLLLIASYTQDRQSGLNAGSRKVAWLAADYFLSKRTDVYVALDNNKLSGAYPLPGFMGTRDSASGMSAGLRHRF